MVLPQNHSKVDSEFCPSHWIAMATYLLW
jgi:hypothetical protein